MDKIGYHKRCSEEKGWFTLNGRVLGTFENGLFGKVGKFFVKTNIANGNSFTLI